MFIDLLQNPHIQTIIPSLFRPMPKFRYERETITTYDDDFLDLDWHKTNSPSSKLALVLHGLEGTSESAYVKNAVLKLHSIGYDALVMNFRGCSGRPNKLHKSYHSGKTEDLDLVINYILNHYHYDEIVLVGFSVGGNMVLKYLGEKGSELDKQIKKSVTFSVPVDLKSSADTLAKPNRAIYMKYLLGKLYKKLLVKQKLFPEFIDLRNFSEIKTFHQFDARYTAPMNGFKDELDYWEKASSKPYLNRITIPSLLITAKDDPFLGPECPPETCLNSNFRVLLTDKGGHVGFWKLEFKCFLPVINFYHEELMLDFLTS
jgi:uncharacterized protein